MPLRSTALILHTDTVSHDFQQASLQFRAGTNQDVFAQKINKTLAETILHRRYQNLSNVVHFDFASYLEWRLGDFLAELKRRENQFYRKFLNRYGDLTYCRFQIHASDPIRGQKGVYAFTSQGELRYIGRCRDSFSRRINQGYGTIHPKNCYRDGQATNCHLNSLIAPERLSVSLWVHVMTDDRLIEAVELQMIGRYQPPWNIAMKNR